MKKVILLLLCVLVMLSACSKREIPTSDDIIIEHDIITPTLEPIIVEEPEIIPTEEPTDPTPISILTDIYNNYHPGTAGCSLKAAACAAQLLDWYYLYEDPDCARGSAANFAAVNDLSEEATHANGISVDFDKKFAEIWRSAMSLAFGNVGVLNDAGYHTENACRWRPDEVSALFETLYSGLGLPLPETVRIYYGDENAEHLLSALYPTAADEYSVLAALRMAGHFDGSVELLSFTKAGGEIKLDFNAAFARRVSSTGTAGEYIIMGSLVNTYLDAFRAATVTVTVDGSSWESGHVIYDMPMGRFEE